MLGSAVRVALAAAVVARGAAQETQPHAMAGCAWDKGWLGSTCPRVHSRELVRPNGCCIGGGREGQCPLNCPGEVLNNASGTFCECQMPCDPRSLRSARARLTSMSARRARARTAACAMTLSRICTRARAMVAGLARTATFRRRCAYACFRTDRERCARSSDHLLKRTPAVWCSAMTRRAFARWFTATP